MRAELFQLFSRRERAQAVALLLLMTGGAVLEVLGIGLIAPIVALLADMEAVVSQPLVGKLYAWSGAASPEQFAVYLLVWFVALIFTKNVYLALLSHLQNRFLYAKQAALSRRLFAGFLLAPYSLHVQRHSSDVMRNFATEINSLFAGIVVPLLAIGAEGLVLVLVVVTLSALMPLAALAALAAGALLVTFAYVVLRSMLTRYGQERAARSGERLRTISEALGGLKELKVMGREEYFIDAFGTANDRYLKASRMFATLNTMPRPLIETLAVVALVGAGLFLAIASPSVRAALPAIALLCAAVLRLMPAATRILVAMASIRFYRPVLTQVIQDMELHGHARPKKPIQRVANPLKLSKQLEIRELDFSYPGTDKRALDGVSLRIPAGVVCGLVGASGAGKSTLADLILGIFEPQSGAILVDGVDVGERLADWRNAVGYVPQTVQMLDDTVRRNIAFGLPDAEIDDARVWSALAAAQIDSSVRRMPRGLDENIGERGVRLSGGQRQRLGIARALYLNPGVLILDEATSSLDIQTEGAIAETVLALRGDRTIIVIAHRLDTIRRCDLLFFLADGKLRSQGSYDELVAGNPDFAALVGKFDC
jgi:ATP-binding cassette subfamily C protein